MIAAAVLMSPTAALAQEIYVPDAAQQTVSVLNANTLLPVAGSPITVVSGDTENCPGGGVPDAVVLTPDHEYALVSLDGCDQVAVIDTKKKAVVRYITTFPSSQETQIFIRPTGDRAYVTACSMSFMP